MYFFFLKIQLHAVNKKLTSNTMIAAYILYCLNFNHEHVLVFSISSLKCVMRSQTSNKFCSPQGKEVRKRYKVIFKLTRKGLRGRRGKGQEEVLHTGRRAPVLGRAQHREEMKFGFGLCSPSLLRDTAGQILRSKTQWESCRDSSPPPHPRLQVHKAAEAPAPELKD